MKKRSVANVDLTNPKKVITIEEITNELIKRSIAKIDDNKNAFEIITDTIPSTIEFTDENGNMKKLVIYTRRHKHKYVNYTFKLDAMLDDAPKHTRAILRYMIYNAGIDSNYFEFNSKRKLMEDIGYINNKGQKVPFNEATFYKIINWLKDNNIIYEDKNRFIFNHNYFMYGSYTKFVNNYIKVYGNE